jgi:hypothetical protein
MQPHSSDSLTMPFVGILLIGGGMLALSRLFVAPERRDVNWGKGGRGGPCSSLSILVWGFSFIAFGAFVELSSFSILHSDLAPILGALIVVPALTICAIRDSILDKRRKTPNHSPDPTLASGTSPAGQEPRHR